MRDFAELRARLVSAGIDGGSIDERVDGVVAGDESEEGGRESPGPRALQWLARHALEASAAVGQTVAIDAVADAMRGFSGV